MTSLFSFYSCGIFGNFLFRKHNFFSKAVFIFACIISQNLYSQKSRDTDSLLNIISKNPHDTIKANCYNYLSQEFLNKDAPKAKLYVQKALDLSKKNNYKKGLAFSYHLMGTIFYQSNIEKGLEYFMLSINTSKELNDKHTMSSTYNNLGNLYNQKGDYEKALKYYLISLDLDDELGNRSGMATSYNNVGLIYWMQSNLDKAQEFFEKALHIYKNLNRKDGIAATYSNIGGVAYYKNKKDVALNFFYKAYEMYKEIDNKSGSATSLSNISEILVEQEKYAEAIDICYQAIELQEQLGNKSDMVYAYLSIAKNFIAQAKYAKATEVINKAINLSNELNAQILLSKSYSLMAEVNEKANNYIEALKYHKMYIAINDSIFTKESNAQIAEMNAKYENDKKNKEIELLTKENEIQELNQDVERGRNLMIRNILIVGIVFIFILAFVLYNRTKVKQRANNILSEKNKNIEDQKVQIEIQHALLEQKNKDITDSIKYAQRLQDAIIPSPKKVNETLAESFVLFKPKDIVSGDFYWLEAIDNFVLLAAADCTGHGVPGAFMSIIGNNLLNQAVKIYGNTQPSLILDNVNENLSVMLNQPQSTNSIKDGMDISLCKIEKLKSGNYNLEWAGANNPLWIISSANNTTNANNENVLELFEFVPDKQPVGAFVGEELKPFTNHSVEIKKGETVYLFTDGFPDQFGGPKGKKYKYAQFKKTLQKINSFSMQEQKHFLENEICTWMGELEQVDDILIIGFRV